MAGCNDASLYDPKVRKLNEIREYWTSKRNINRRFTKPDGKYDKEASTRGLKWFVESIVEKPFSDKIEYTPGEYRRMKASMDFYDKDLTGKFRNLAGILAVPRGLARLDPISRNFYAKLEDIKNYERNSMSFVEFSLQGIKNLILSAHVNVGRGSKIFGNKSYRNFRTIRDKMLKAGQFTEVLKHQAELESFFKSDDGRLLNEYRELIKMDKTELETALKDGYRLNNVKHDYDSNVVNAIELTRNTLNTLGSVHIKSLDALDEVFKYKYSNMSDSYMKISDKLKAAKERIKIGIENGSYFPKIVLESMYDVKMQLEKILPEQRMFKLKAHTDEMVSVVDRLINNLSAELPDNIKAKDRTLEGIWETDPFVVIEKYSRDAIQFNKNIHTQSAYLKAMKDIPNADTEFLKGMKRFITEEYAVAVEGNKGRPDWVNDMVRTVNGFQTARTMGLNVTGGIKNAASVLHYHSKVGFKAIADARQLRQIPEIKEVLDKVEKEEGFLFSAKDNTVVMEGFVGRDKYREADLSFNEEKGEYYYRNEPVREFLEAGWDKTISGLLVFHRWTENGQRKHMFRTSFVNKYNELRNINGVGKIQAEKFAKTYALKMVNGWAYEYAPFAKNKYVRGDGVVVDEVGENYIVKKDNSSTAFGKGLSEITFHLMHYPMSLLETHINELRGAKESIYAGQYNSSEMQYLARYAGLYGLISLGSVIANANFHNILENETINRILRIERDLTEFDNEERATFGLLSEFTGPTIGHLKYLSIVSGLINVDTPTEKIVFGNVDYTETSDEVQRYTDYQYSTEYGRLKNKIIPAIRDGRSTDLLRHWLAWYPSEWIKQARSHIPLFAKKTLNTQKEKNAAALQALQNV